MSENAIVVENLSKRYLIGHQSSPGQYKYNALRDVIGRELRNFARKAADVIRGQQVVQGDEIEEFWALRDVSFEVKAGQVLGIVGRNGSGKSTLLKILSRITDPTKGRVELYGRVSSLLEVGTGFHPELTGRENIFLNGAILGMSQREIRKKFDEIVAFAEVERFLDTPVKYYSSGMYVRLAFAVAAHLEPEILIIDEVLAVGDVEFQKKCLGKMSEVARGGRTVLFVSHNHAAVRNLCSHGLLMSHGQASEIKNVVDVLEKYSAQQAQANFTWARNADNTVDSPVWIESIAVRLQGHQPDLQLICTVCVISKESRRSFFIAVDFLKQPFGAIMQAVPHNTPFAGGVAGECWIELIVNLPPLVPGQYQLDFWIGPHNEQTFDYVRNAIAIDVTESPSADRIYPFSPDQGFVVPRSTATIRY
jgi:homopolymeric O-antigen transport system ATP-binding protein